MESGLAIDRIMRMRFGSCFGSASARLQNRKESVMKCLRTSTEKSSEIYLFSACAVLGLDGLAPRPRSNDLPCAALVVDCDCDIIA